MSTTLSAPDAASAYDAERVVRDEQLAAQKIPITRVKVVSVGGGLGSFALVDRLRIGGVAESDIAVVSTHRQPAGAFVDRCIASGLDLDDRLRADSGARMDNPWGFPGYAAEEAWSSRSIKPLVRVVGDPVSDAYNPTLGLMHRGVTREGRRIGWSRMSVVAQADYLFKREGGGYFVVCRKGTRTVALHCDHVHLALGAPGPALSPETESFRAEHPDSTRLRHVYESHEDVLEDLAHSGGSVIVRGAGMAASHLLDRIAEARDRHGADIHVWHVLRDWPVDDGTGPDRRIGLGFVHQELDFPRAAYGGELRDQLLATADEDTRLDLIERWGATSTPYRPASAEALRRGRFEGWYDAVVGEVQSFMPRGGKVVAAVRLQNGEDMALAADHVLDATGLDDRADHHGLVADLVTFSPVSVNRLGGLRVDERFAVIGAASGDGQVFASGATARGGHYGPVDSFTGMQYAALTIADELASAGVGHRLGPWRSFTGWLRWMGGKSL